MSAIEVRALCQVFSRALFIPASAASDGRAALSDVSFTVARGEVVGLLGHNGAGKTTLLRVLAGALVPTRGEVYIGGRSVRSEPQNARARVGYLPEQVPLYKELRVVEFLRYRASLKDVLPVTIPELLQRVGLRGHERRLIGELSKGLRQRVGLCDALLGSPEVLLLDEPTDGLDPEQRRETLRLIRELGKDRAVILSTHVVSEAESLCTRALLLEKGRLVHSGALSEVSTKMGWGPLAPEPRGEPS